MTDDEIRELLERPTTWAVVGCSPDPARDSNSIARLLQDRGNRIIPVNPNASEVLGEPCYASLAEIPEQEEVEVVDVFRRADQAGAHVDEAIERGTRVVWMQLGVVDETAADRARAAGLKVAMDRCPRIELRRLGIS